VTRHYNAWIVVTDPQVRAQIGEFCQRSAGPRLASAAAAGPGRGAGRGDRCCPPRGATCWPAGPGDWGPPGPRCTRDTRPGSPRCPACPGDIRQGALIPTACYTGATFRPAARRPPADVLHVDHW